MALRNWLTSRAEEEIVEKSTKHMQKVLETVHEFEKAVSFFVKEEKFELALDVLRRVLDLEHEADNIRRDILMNITQSSFPSKIREQLIVIVKRIDGIANSTDLAARRILGISPDDILKLGKETMNLVYELIHKTVDVTKLLYNLIRHVKDIENDDAFATIKQIQTLEHECDMIHTEISTKINSFNFEDLKMNPFVAFHICQFIDLIEDISNRVEDVADYIELIRTIEV